MIAILFIFVIITVIVYNKSEEKGMNGLLWIIFAILPWIGISFLVVYLIHRKDKIHMDFPKKAQVLYRARGMQNMIFYKSLKE
jgi:predicted permease